MSGTHLPFLSIGTDPLDDPLNLEWDAIVRNERPAAPEIDPDDFDLLRRVQAQANRALPEATFFGTLEQRLEELYGVPILKPERQPRLGREDVVPPSKSRARTLPIGPSSRWLPLASAMAVLLLLLIAGFAVLLRAAPGNSEPPPFRPRRVTSHLSNPSSSSRSSRACWPCLGPRPGRTCS